MSRLSTSLALALVFASFNDRAMSQQGDPAFGLAALPNLGEASVSFLDTRNHVEVLRMPVGQNPVRIVMSSDGAFAYVGESGPPMAIRKIDLSPLTEVWKLELPTEQLSWLGELEISPDGQWLAVEDSLKATFMLVDAETAEVVATQALCPTCNGSAGPSRVGMKVVFTSNSEFVWAAVGQLDELVLFSVPDASIVGRVAAPGSGGSGGYGEIMLVDGYDRLPIVHGTFGLTTVFNGITGETWELETLGWGSDLAFASNQGALALSNYGGFNPNTLGVLGLGHMTANLLPAPSTTRQLEYNPFTDEVWAKGGPGIVTFDLKDLSRGPDIAVSSFSSFTEMAFTPGGRFLYYIGQNEVLVFDATARVAPGASGPTYALVATIPVGAGARSVVMQGDDSPSF